MAGQANIIDHAKGIAGTDGRAPWSTPRVIVSDLGDARANTIIPGGDGSVPSYGPYGS